jgi:pilus assembly protein CpaB
MRLRDIIGLAVALLLAIGVAFLTRYFLTKEETHKEVSKTTERSSADLVKILMSAKNLQEGDIIRAGDLNWDDWPMLAMEPTYIKQGTIDINALRGAVVRTRIPQGQPVTAGLFIKPGDKSILAALISPGMRAVSLDVTPQSISSGLIAPGDRVDIILSQIGQAAGGKQAIESKTVAKNLKVLAVDIEMASTHEKPKVTPRVVTLEVTPEQAELIARASKEGALSLSLKGIKKGKRSEEEQENAEETEGESASKQGVVILLRGSEKSEIQVQEQ